MTFRHRIALAALLLFPSSLFGQSAENVDWSQAQTVEFTMTHFALILDEGPHGS